MEVANVIPEDGSRFENPDSLTAQVREYIRVKNSLELLETRQKELREKLFAQLDTDGYEDDKGNIQLELDEPVDEVVRLEKQRRTTRKIDELKADEIIATKQLEDVVYKTVRVVDEDALMAAYYEDKITEQELESMYPAKVTWALMTKKK
jgi:hypothetical protein